ncbi:MAG: hypothetical protein AAGI09_12500 [Pseudomonadota bacterium]
MVALLAIGLSLLGLARLMQSDPKRRRVFRRARFEGERHGLAARILLFGPGAAFLGNGDWSGFTLWFGAMSCVGWACIATPPAFWTRCRALIFAHARPTAPGAGRGG